MLIEPKFSVLVIYVFLLQLDDNLDTDVLNEIHEHYNEPGSEGTTKAVNILQEKVNVILNWPSETRYVENVFLAHHLGLSLSQTHICGL